MKLLPTPTASDSHGGQNAAKRKASGHQLGLNDLVVTCFPSDPTVAPAEPWDVYGIALRRWEAAIGSPMPSPAERGVHGQPRLSSRFVEWLMGLPDGHVTGLDSPYSAELHALGNGVVPQQAEAALRSLCQSVSRG